MAIIAALVLAGCASKPKSLFAPDAASSQTSAESDAVTARPDPVPASPLLGAQADLAVTAGDRILFAVDSFNLEADARETLARQAAWLTRYPHVNVIVAGNADERGTREYNVALGGRRAATVRRFLIASGVAGGRIQTVSYGKERPVDPRSNHDAWAQNRNARTVVLDAVGRGR
jgi:peptidoglycan-associated lipoprotein